MLLNTIERKNSMDKNLIPLIFKAVALGVGIGTLVLNILKNIDLHTSINLLSIGLVCLAIVVLQKK